MTESTENRLYTLLFFGVLLTDQIPKYLVARMAPYGQPVPILGRVVMITYLRNPGTVFGLFRAYPMAVFWAKLAGLTVILGFVCYLFVFGGLKRHTYLNTIPMKLSLILIAASAMANFIDCIRVGAVIDFIDIGIGHCRWHTFNPADAYLVIGAVLLLYVSFRHASLSVPPISGERE